MEITDLVELIPQPGVRGHIVSFENHNDRLWARVQWTTGEYARLPISLLRRIEVRSRAAD